jgi:hypothetical protein
MNYQTFIETKKRRISDSGFEISESQLNKNLFDFQRHIVKTALKKGKYAIFADCGLGKTLMQLEWANQVVKFTQRPVLILTPLAVSGQTIQEGQKFGIEVNRYSGEANTGIFVSNYEQLENIDTSQFAGVVLDESSILKNFDGKTRNLIIGSFIKTEFKLACTATPSPNDPMELGNHSEFLNVMSRNEMLAVYFVHDGGDTSKWRIKRHAKQLFYDWVSEWAVMLSKPSDIGFEAKGYDLPELNLIEKQIVTQKKNNSQLFNEMRISATDFNSELRFTKLQRIEEVVKIVNESSENFIIWIKQDEEGDLIKKMIPDAIEVRGSDSAKSKEEKLLGFAKNEFRVLVTKTKIAQFGLNYQNCNNQIFASLDFSFEGLYQAIRRSYRFGQKNKVNIYLITTDTMQNVVQSVKDKELKFAEMQKAMTNSINKNIHSLKKHKMERPNEIVKGLNFELMLGDCIQLIEFLADESIGISVFSPPFAELYTYSDEPEDMGNSKDYNEFFFAFDILVKQLHRVMMQGRNVIVHCMDLPIQKGKEGFIGLRDFSGMILKSFQDAGFIYHSRVTIWKDPVTEMQRTKALGLLHKQIKKDASMSRVGIPDYLMVFRKDGERGNPVIHQDDDAQKPNYLPVDLWQKYASPVWYDIDYGNTLNAREARTENDEKHICPLQIPTIERALHLWSNEGDTLLTPFAGIGSEVYTAIKMKRKAIGFELKKSYFDIAVKNCKNAELISNQITLF